MSFNLCCQLDGKGTQIPDFWVVIDPMATIADLKTQIFGILQNSESVKLRFPMKATDLELSKVLFCFTHTYLKFNL